MYIFCKNEYSVQLCTKTIYVISAYNSKKIEITENFHFNIEFLLQKLSELGVKKLVPFESEFTIKKPKDKAERYKKLAEEACKQCGRSLPLEVAECISFKAMLKEISKTEKTFFAYEIELDGSLSVKDMLEELKEDRDIALIVGSEGGFSQREAESILEAGASAVSLGKRILRCETACVAMTALVSLYLEN